MLELILITTPLAIAVILSALAMAQAGAARRPEGPGAQRRGTRFRAIRGRPRS
jgi:hypothetical protein